MLHLSVLDDEIRRVTIGDRDFWLDVARNKLLPVVRGAAEGDPPAPSGTPPAATPPTPATPPPPAATPPAGPDLSALQRELDKAKRTGTSEATTELLKKLGFDKLDDAQRFVTTARDAETAALSEVEKREKAAADREAAAEAREKTASDLVNRGVIRDALRTAGVSADNLDDAEGLVKISGDVTEDSAKEAIAALKAKPAFASLFTAVGSPTAPSGVTPGGPPGSPAPPQTGMEAGRDLARKEAEARKDSDPLKVMNVVGATRA